MLERFGDHAAQRRGLGGAARRPRRPHHRPGRSPAHRRRPRRPTPPASSPSPAAATVRRSTARRRDVSWLWPGLAVAAAALVAFAAGALLTGGDDDQAVGEPVADVELTATDLSSRRARRGRRSSTPAPASRSTSTSPVSRRRRTGEYYEGWLHDAQSGDWVSVGTFHMRERRRPRRAVVRVCRSLATESWSSPPRSRDPLAAMATSSSRGSSKPAEQGVLAILPRRDTDHESVSDQLLNCKSVPSRHERFRHLDDLHPSDRAAAGRHRSPPSCSPGLSSPSRSAPTSCARRWPPPGAPARHGCCCTPAAVRSPSSPRCPTSARCPPATRPP